MPSSLVFAALAVAWIVVLVPMVARRRQEVRRTADSALAARVLRRGDAHGRPEEVPDMAELDDDAIDTDDTDDFDDRDVADDDGYADEPTERRYRPGRGGFDPYAAELAARARYAYRQRVVLALILLALASGLFAAFAVPIVWWAHAGIDVTLVGYLVYLRQQVRIEQEVRQRRVDRATRGRRPSTRYVDDHPHADLDDDEDSYDDAFEAGDPLDDADVAAQPPPQPRRRVQPRPAHPGAAIVDLDDEDPGLCDLDTDTVTPYRRAAGE